ncbi:MAG: sulfatase [Zavarzinella sp.]
MRFYLIFLILFTFSVSAVAAAPPNILLICVDDLRPELGCYGVGYIKTPHIDALAKRSRIFTRHYVQAPTCGASRYTLLTGSYGPAGNDALFRRAAQMKTQPQAVAPSMPEWFRNHGYQTVSIGKVSHHPGGRGGPDWNNDEQPEMPGAWDRHLLPAGAWKHPRGWMHGLANGQIREKVGEMPVFQAEAGGDEIYPDGVTVPEAIRQLQLLGQPGEKPFLLAVGILRPHLPFGAPKKYLDLYDNVELPKIPHPDKPKGKTTWHNSGEFMKYQRWNRNPNTDAEFATQVRRHYAACVSYADASLGHLLNALNDSPAAKNTIIILWGDHGWHLGEHAIWGKHSLFEESLRSPLIIHYPGIEKPGEATRAIVETRDLFPTICELTDTKRPDFLKNRDQLLKSLRDPKEIGGAAVSYTGNAQTIRTDRYRLIQHRDGSTELYDHTTTAGETRNIAADNPEIVARLRRDLDNHLKPKQK